MFSRVRVPMPFYLFEDNAAVFQVINKGRSPQLRHVTRMH